MKTLKSSPCQSTVAIREEATVDQGKLIYVFILQVDLEADENRLSPLIWITLSLSSAILLAINHELQSLVAIYEFKTYYLQSPGSLIASLVVFFVYSYQGCRQKSEDSQSLIKKQTIDNQWFNFEWLRDIYCEKIYEQDNIENSYHNYRIIKMRIFSTVLLLILNFLTFWISVESVYYAVSIDLNLGVLG